MAKKYKDKTRAKFKVREKVRNNYRPTYEYAPPPPRTEKSYNPYQEMMCNLMPFMSVMKKMEGINAETQRETVDMVIDKLLEAPKEEGNV